MALSSDQASTSDLLPTSTKPNWDQYYLGLAATVSWRADCHGRQVGAVVVRENRILTTGYNGTPEGWRNCGTENGCPRCLDREQDPDGPRRRKSDKVQSKDLDLCVCVHAEANAMITAARFGIALDGAEMYVTDQPCLQCAKEMVQVGISRVTYLRKYRVTNSATEIGKDVLGVQHQLMRDLRARKYVDTNIGADLAAFAQDFGSSPNAKIDTSMTRSALDDDQYPPDEVAEYSTDRTLDDVDL